MKHLMLDLETWGNRPGCIVRSIGAVVFDPKSEEIGAGFYANIKDPTASDFHKDDSTVEWWSKQGDKAKELLEDKQFDALNTVKSFNAFCIKHGVKHVWSHGAGFDVPIWQFYIDHYELETPWKFWDVRDTRTIYDLANVRSEFEDGMVKHYAFDDALAQARAVQRAYKILNI